MDLIDKVNSDYLLLTNSIIKSKESNKIVEINIENIIHPSPEIIRKAFLNISNDVLRKICGYQSIIIIGNLASKFGSAILPILAQILGARKKIEIVCIVILPFSFEKEKLFRCGVSLSLLSNYIENIIVIDNDAVIRNSEEIPLEEHYNSINQVASDIIVESINKCFPLKFNLVTTSGNSNSKINTAFIDTMATLSEKINLSQVQKYSIYLYQSSQKVSVIKNVVESLSNLLPAAEQDINLVLDKRGQTRCHILVKTSRNVISLYDPLDGLIPKDNVLDFEPEIAMDKGVKLDKIRDLESSLLFR
jgi:cell division protein FtsZ